MSEEERRRSFAEGTPKASGRYVTRFIAVLVVVGVVGLFADFLLGQLSGTPAKKAPPHHAPTHQIQTSLQALMGLKPIGHQAALGFSLTDQFGKSWALDGARGRVVVLAFFNANCADICPVLGGEIRQAQADLGNRAAKVDFVIVNTDPHDLATVRAPRALSVTGLAGRPHVFFVNGTIPQLNPVWTNYQITITVGAGTNQMAHNNLLYFIGRRGGLADVATPFANEATNGVYTLSRSLQTQWATGIAQTAGSLLP